MYKQVCLKLICAFATMRCENVSVIFHLFYFSLFVFHCTFSQLVDHLSSNETADSTYEGNSSLAPMETKVISELTDPSRYDKESRPLRDKKTIVYVHMHVYALESIDSQNLRYTTQILLRYRWHDPRLQHNIYIKYEGGQMLDRIWSPHIYIVNEQDAKVLGSSQRDMFISIWPDGTVVQLSRMKVTLGCSMHFQKFPFDGQICPLILESWSYNASQLKLVWEHNSPVTSDTGLQLPEYTLRNIILNSSVNHYDQQAATNLAEHVDVFYGKSAKNFTTLTVFFDVHRQSRFYIMDYYMPSVLIVAVSWVSFWLDANSTPGRTILGTSTLLTFITLSRNIGNSLPKVSYIKSSEIWFIGCTVFIFGSLVEFAFVNTIWRRKKNVELQKVSGKHILKSTLTPQLYHKQFKSVLNSSSLTSVSSTVDSQRQCTGNFHSFKPSTTSTESIDGNRFQLNTLQNNNPAAIVLELEEDNEETSKSVFTMTPQEIADWIDRRSRICFPVAFVLFNCLYWTWTLFLY